MKKVHILTFHRALNYGAILQCYSLYKTISQISECDVIDYRARCIENRYKVFVAGKSLKEIVKALLTAPVVKMKRTKFDEFIKNNITMTQTANSHDELKRMSWSESDCFCVGSDQVWNFDLITGDSSFFFDFVPQEVKRFSYAASIGADLKEEWKKLFQSYLADFSAVSVREKTAQKQLDSCEITASIEIDPVFLLKREEWFDKARNINSDSFVLIYLLQKADSFMKSAIEFAQEHGKKVIIISTGLRRQYDAKYVSDCGPEEFLGYFKAADTIFTNSFHGIAFSILFNKQFYYQLQGNNVKTNSRLYDIISLFQLEKRNINNINNADCIDYSFVNTVIEQKRKSAIDYLKNQIVG